MAVVPLPDPQWSQSASVCLSCGYSLEGLPSHGQCPECGAEYQDFQLVLWGVPNKSSQPNPLRRLLWGIFISGWAIHVYTWAFWLAWGGLYLVGAITGVLAIGIIWLIATGPRERRGTERFVVTPSGIARVASKLDPASRRLDTIFIPWGVSDRAQVERISPVWKRLRIGRLSEGLYGRMRDIVFDAGFRCPDADAAAVQDAIQGNILGRLTVGPHLDGPAPSGQHISLNPPPSSPNPP